MYERVFFYYVRLRFFYYTPLPWDFRITASYGDITLTYEHCRTPRSPSLPHIIVRYLCFIVAVTQRGSTHAGVSP